MRISGAAGNRTPVQVKFNCTLYMLSRYLIFCCKLAYRQAYLHHSLNKFLISVEANRNDKPELYGSTTIKGKSSGKTFPVAARLPSLTGD